MGVFSSKPKPLPSVQYQPAPLYPASSLYNHPLFKQGYNRGVLTGLANSPAKDESDTILYQYLQNDYNNDTTIQQVQGLKPRFELVSNMPEAAAWIVGWLSGFFNYTLTQHYADALDNTDYENFRKIQYSGYNDQIDWVGAMATVVNPEGNTYIDPNSSFYYIQPGELFSYYKMEASNPNDTFGFDPKQDMTKVAQYINDNVQETSYLDALHYTIEWTFVLKNSAKVGDSFDLLLNIQSGADTTVHLLNVTVIPPVHKIAPLPILTWWPNYTPPSLLSSSSSSSSSRISSPVSYQLQLLSPDLYTNIGYKYQIMQVQNGVSTNVGLMFYNGEGRARIHIQDPNKPTHLMNDPTQPIYLADFTVTDTGSSFNFLQPYQNLSWSSAPITQ